MVLVVILIYLSAAVLPALARSWRSWCILSTCALLPAGLILWITVSSEGTEVLWLGFLMWSFLGIAAVGMFAGAFGLMGRDKGWKAATRPISTLFAGSIAVISLAYGAVSAMSVVP